MGDMGAKVRDTVYHNYSFLQEDVRQVTVSQLVKKVVQWDANHGSGGSRCV